MMLSWCISMHDEVAYDEFRPAVDLADRFHGLLIGIAGRSYCSPF